ncbi:M14 family metallopeptidase [Aliikangiella coralliicola]|uniref:M14 family metallopeptidase n=1 Tax=Aliikangiella coralliicola TaxID=2592383 RepID=UPI001AEFC03B|nr:M14-type cytosolic carboxypeptidase [Aliikangiella coralliicola]
MFIKKFFLIFLLLGCTSGSLACDFSNVVFDASFSAARLSECTQRGDNSFLLTIKPENHPINDSPWYAFKVSAKDERKIRIAIEFVNGKHRYLPKISRDGLRWAAIPHRLKNKRLTFSLKVDQKPIWVAGQEIITNQHYQSWLKQLSQNSNYTMSVLGNSTENRPIYQLESLSPSNEWVVITGRMHPPEITGALALFPFTQTLLLDQSVGEKFRKRFNVLIVPNLNPDGVEHGNWRHNAKGVDLNRDWNKFKQQETKLVHQKLQNIVANGGKIVFAMDFHSTSKDIFYTMPTDYGIQPPMLVEDWLNQLEAEMPDFKVIIKPGNNPSKGVFKQYIADTYGVQAITYEMGDNTDRKKIISIAKNAAQLFMKKLLDTPKEKFYQPKNKK